MIEININEQVMNDLRRMTNSLKIFCVTLGQSINIIFAVFYVICNNACYLGAIHILRQPPEGGEGVIQMLTIADEGG